MNLLPEIIKKSLVDPCFKRVESNQVDIELAKLSVSVPEVFREFYKTYVGCFNSKKTGFELLDLYDDSESIITETKVCREEYGFPLKYLVISGYFGNSVLVYDAEVDLVYNVDFEGGDELLISGDLKPEWKSFKLFLEFFFG